MFSVLKTALLVVYYLTWVVRVQLNTHNLFMNKSSAVGFRLCLCVCTHSSLTALRPVNPAFLWEDLFSVYTSN